MVEIQTIKLGGFVDDEVKKVNDNFAAINGAIPTKTSDITNDSGYQTADDVSSAVNAAMGGISVPTKVSEFENDANYVSSDDAAFKNKVDAEAGKGLSSNDYTTEDKNKVGKLGKIDFAAASFTNDTDGYMSATIPAAGKYPVTVMRKSGTDYEEVIAHVKVSGDNIIIVSSEAFEGYVVTI